MKIFSRKTKIMLDIDLNIKSQGTSEGGTACGVMFPAESDIWVNVKNYYND